MSTARKTMLIAATVLVVGGAAIAAWAFGAAEFNLENLSTTARDWTQTTRTLDPEADAPHTAVVVRDDTENVRFEPTSGNAFEVTYWTSGDKDVRIDDEGGALVVEGTEKPHRGVLLMDIDFQDRATVVKVPASYAGTISVETASGNVELAELSSLEAVSVTTSSGSIDAASLAADDIVLEASSGTIDATVEGSAADYEVFATSSSGTIEAPRGTAGADKRVSLRTSSGSIDLSFALDAAEPPEAPEAPETPEAPEAPDAP